MDTALTSPRLRGEVAPHPFPPPLAGEGKGGGRVRGPLHSRSQTGVNALMASGEREPLAAPCVIAFPARRRGRFRDAIISHRLVRHLSGGPHSRRRSANSLPAGKMAANFANLPPFGLCRA